MGSGLFHRGRYSSWQSRFLILIVFVAWTLTSECNENWITDDIACETRRICDTRTANLRASPTDISMARSATGSLDEIPRNRCFSLQAPKKLDWPTSGVWHGDQLIFADSLNRSLVTLQTRTQNTSLRALPSSLNKAGAISEIRKIPGSHRGYLVEDEAESQGDRLIQLDAELNPVSTLQVQGRDFGNGWELDVIYDWQPTVVNNSLGILAFADLKNNENEVETWKSGLVFFDKHQRNRIFQQWPTNLDFVGQSTRENGYIATTDHNGFMLVWDAEPYLLKVDLSLDSISKKPTRIEIPEDLRQRPVLAQHPDWKFTSRGAEQLALHLKTVEDHSGAASLLTLNSKLLLLSRDVDAEGVGWNLSELDGADGSEITRVPLPVPKGTRHLTVAADETYAAFLTKGGVENLSAGGWSAPFLPIREISVFPASWISDLRSGRLRATKACF